MLIPSIIVQIGENGSSGVEQGCAWASRMEARYLYVVACWGYSHSCKYAQLGLYWDSPRTAIWIWYVMFFPFILILDGKRLDICLNHMLRVKSTCLHLHCLADTVAHSSHMLRLIMCITLFRGNILCHDYLLYSSFVYCLCTVS